MQGMINRSSNHYYYQNNTNSLFGFYPLILIDQVQMEGRVTSARTLLDLLF